MTALRLRYLATGACLALTGALLVALGHACGLFGLASAVLSSAVVVPLGYTAQRRFVFRASGPWLRGLGGYAGLALSNLPVGWVTVFLLVDLGGQNAFASALVATALVAAANYLVLSRLVFRRTT